MVPETSFYAFLARYRGELFRDDAFAALYTAKTGRPSVPPSLLATALVLQAYDGVSDAEARDRATYDLRWKIALGIELEARPFAKSTLQEFRAQLIVHQEQAAIFQESLALAKRQGKFRGDRKITLALDTTTILGRGAVKDTYNLLADGIVQVLRVLAQQSGEALAVVAEREGLERYVAGASLKGDAAIDWDDRAARTRFLGEIVADADRLLDIVRTTRSQLEPDGPEEQALATAAGSTESDLAARYRAGGSGTDAAPGRGPRSTGGGARSGNAPWPQERPETLRWAQSRCRRGYRDAADHGGRRAARECTGSRSGARWRWWRPVKPPPARRWPRRWGIVRLGMVPRARPSPTPGGHSSPPCRR